MSLSSSVRVCVIVDHRVFELAARRAPIRVVFGIRSWDVVPRFAFEVATGATGCRRPPSLFLYSVLAGVLDVVKSAHVEFKGTSLPFFLQRSVTQLLVMVDQGTFAGVCLTGFRSTVVEEVGNTES